MVGQKADDRMLTEISRRFAVGVEDGNIAVVPGIHQVKSVSG